MQGYASSLPTECWAPILIASLVAIVNSSSVGPSPDGTRNWVPLDVELIAPSGINITVGMHILFIDKLTCD